MEQENGWYMFHSLKKCFFHLCITVYRSTHPTAWGLESVYTTVQWLDSGCPTVQQLDSVYSTVSATDPLSAYFPNLYRRIFFKDLIFFRNQKILKSITTKMSRSMTILEILPLTRSFQFSALTHTHDWRTLQLKDWIGPVGWCSEKCDPN